MSHPPGKFAPPSPHDVTRLVLEHPFAWVVTSVGSDFAATPLPLRPVVDANGEVVELLGHFARRNPHVELARAAPHSLVLFMGPHGYISSSWLGDRTRTPTWNYATAQYLVALEFTDDPDVTREMVRDLVDAMELGRPRSWSVDEMGARYERLVSGIVAFRARILERRVKFKLGQDERDAEFTDIARALHAGGELELLEWMNRCNAARARS